MLMEGIGKKSHVRLLADQMVPVARDGLCWRIPCQTSLSTPGEGLGGAGRGSIESWGQPLSQQIAEC